MGQKSFLESEVPSHVDRMLKPWTSSREPLTAPNLDFTLCIAIWLQRVIENILMRYLGSLYSA